MTFGTLSLKFDLKYFLIKMKKNKIYSSQKMFKIHHEKVKGCVEKTLTHFT